MVSAGRMLLFEKHVSGCNTANKKRKLSYHFCCVFHKNTHHKENWCECGEGRVSRGKGLAGVAHEPITLVRSCAGERWYIAPKRIHETCEGVASIKVSQFCERLEYVCGSHNDIRYTNESVQFIPSSGRQVSRKWGLGEPMMILMSSHKQSRETATLMYCPYHVQICPPLVPVHPGLTFL